MGKLLKSKLNKKTVLAILAIVLLVLFLVVTLIYFRRNLSPSDDQAAEAVNWWNSDWSFRVLVTVATGNYERNDKPAELNLNFTSLLTALSKNGTFDKNSIRVVEVNTNNVVIDDSVPFQFDQSADYNAASNAAGNLTVLVEGSTSANTTRRYHVYFDKTGKNFSPAVFPTQVALTDNVTHKGFASIRIVTGNGEYFYHKEGGGFATLLDKENKDWINWNASTGAAGDFRGIPNMVHPQDGGYFHPGRTTANSSVVSQGPLKATFKSNNDNNQWETLWEIFPKYARMTVKKTPGTAYWFLYEGVPGGTLDVNSDRLTRSDKTSILASGTWTTDIPNEEWLFVSDSATNRSIFLAHHTDDDKIDGYSQMDNQMTVFGFGRSGNTRFLTGVNRQFTFGLTESTNYDQVKPDVYNAYTQVTASAGTPEFNNVSTTPGTSITVPTTITPTNIGTSTPTPTPTTTPSVGVTASVTTTVNPTPTSPSPTGTAIACGKSDEDGNGKFEINDFIEFAKVYQRNCNDKDMDYGVCGHRDVDKSGKVEIADFISFAKRYAPRESCAL